MITRSQYMENSSELHHDYWSQFVTPATISFVKNHIGIDKLKASKDPHLNDVVKWEQGGKTWLWDRSPMNIVKAKELGENCSRSSHTCTGKAAARIILEES